MRVALWPYECAASALMLLLLDQQLPLCQAGAGLVFGADRLVTRGAGTLVRGELRADLLKPVCRDPHGAARLAMHENEFFRRRTIGTWLLDKNFLQAF